VRLNGAHPRRRAAPSLPSPPNSLPIYGVNRRDVANYKAGVRAGGVPVEECRSIPGAGSLRGAVAWRGGGIGAPPARIDLLDPRGNRAGPGIIEGGRVEPGAEGPAGGRAAICCVI